MKQFAPADDFASNLPALPGDVLPLPDARDRNKKSQTRNIHLKIAYILNTYPQPSQSFIRREVQALERQGVDVHRIAMRRSDQPLLDKLDREEAARTSYVLEAGALRLLWGGLIAFGANPRLFFRALAQAWQMGRVSQSGVLRHLIYLAEACFVSKVCRAEGISHCHAHFGTNATAVARLVKALGGAGYSFTTHGPEEFDAPEALSLGAKLDDASFAIGVSAFGCSQLRRWAALDTWPCLHVVHCGIEPIKFEAPPMLPEGTLGLISIGRFVEQKGQVVLLEALGELRKRGVDFHLDLVGDGELRPLIERAIDEHALSDVVTLTGWLDEAALNEALAQAQVLVMPSFAEGLPVVIMEAMALARPVLATQVAGIPELVRPQETGWLTAAGDVEGLVGQLQNISALAHSDLVTMGQKGRARVLERHDIDHEAAKLADLFRANAPD